MPQARWRGHVRLALSSDHHATFSRSGHDLNVTLSLTLREALLGFHKHIVHLDNRTLHVERSVPTSPGTHMWSNISWSGHLSTYITQIACLLLVAAFFFFICLYFSTLCFCFVVPAHLQALC